MSNTQKIFSKIYDTHSWSGESKSGPGSDPGKIGDYVNFVHESLQSIFQTTPMSVLDIGCGDFMTGRNLNHDLFSNYVGIDVVKSIIDSNQKSFGNAKTSFHVCDILEQDCPHADIALVKDVLQHLSNDDVHCILNKLRNSVKYAIITNDLYKWIYKKKFGIVVKKIEAPNQSLLNENIERGESRPLDLTKNPFDLIPLLRKQYKVLVTNKPHRVIYIKDVLLVEFIK